MSPLLILSAGRRMLSSSFKPAAPRLLVSSGRSRWLTTAGPGKSPEPAGKLAGMSPEDALREMKEEFRRQGENHRAEQAKWSSRLTRWKGLYYCTVIVVFMGVAGSMLVPRKKFDRGEFDDDEVVYDATGTMVSIVGGGKQLLFTVDLKEKKGKGKKEKKADAAAENKADVGGKSPDLNKNGKYTVDLKGEGKKEKKADAAAENKAADGEKPNKDGK